ncbi:hypothetical protein ACFQZE_09200 [Paenibacillus sp. GCM10027627]|uniref:hypothetical protein n=1 Tax=unclassified Paenibacillus TaxID=185978 RepID=UPI0036410450
MIKLLKYDWIKNANIFTAGLIILVLAQLALAAVGWKNGWNTESVFAGATGLYAVGALLVFLMACQTFNDNLKAYSRRLLPLPTLYTIATPIILLFAGQLVIGVLFIFHDWIALPVNVDGEMYSFTKIVFDKVTTLGTVSFIIAYLWVTFTITIIIFFSIAFSRTIDGKAGVFFGILVCAALFIFIPWMERLFIPNSPSSAEKTGFISFDVFEPGEIEGSDMLASPQIFTFDWLDIKVALFEIAIVSLLVYCIVYMINKKMKL